MAAPGRQSSLTTLAPGPWPVAPFFLLLALSAARADTGGEACATCHREIFESSRTTGMARSSGVVTSIDAEGALDHNGVRYRVYRQDGTAKMGFAAGGIEGRRRLEYFVGSGSVGRSYLFTVDGFLYQAPVSWYTAAAKWDLSPGYRQFDQLYLTRGIEPVCLDCHASGVQAAAGTAYGYRSPPFREGGVSCERCHGAGDAHAAGRGPIVNPSKLTADRRDSICAQCHLAGEARIARPDAAPFRPGDLLADSQVVFEWTGEPDLKVTSHFETLAVSACKKASGDRLWCGTCHDPHRAPSESAKAEFYRAKCLGCHQPSECARGADCAGCHMPKAAVRDVQHAAYTDHRIRKPGGRASTSGARRLVPFGGAAAGDREFGLAYASLAGFEKQARAFLERASQDDAEVLAHLAYLYESGGDPTKAAPLYTTALRLDPSQVAAAVNLGNLYAKSGQERDAMRLWRSALEKSPGLETVLLSLAVAQFRSGDRAGGAESLRKLLALNPANRAARKLLDEARTGH